MKKLLALLLVAVLALSLMTACGDGGTENTTANQTSSTDVTDDVASNGDFVPEELPATNGDLTYDYGDLPASDGDLDG